MLFKLWAHLSYFLGDFWFYLALIFFFFLVLIFWVYKIYELQIGQNKKKLLIALGVTLFIVILVYSFLEAYFRYRYDESDGLGFLKVNERWHKRYVIYNNYFFRDRNFELLKKSGTVRIGVMGDSVTFGGGIKNVDNRFSNILEKKLKDAGFNVEVYNLGKPGYDTDGEIEVYQGVRHLKFDILVWEYFLNDIQQFNKSTGTPILIKNSQTGNVVRFLSDKSFFFDWMFWRLSSRYNKTLLELRTADLARYKDAEQLATHKKQITDFMESLHQDNTKVVVVIFPLLVLLGPNYGGVGVHQAMAAHFRASGAEVVDLLDYLKNRAGRSLWASEFDSHPNEEVHRLAAEKLYEKVVPLLKSLPTSGNN